MKVIYVAGPFRAASESCPGHQDMMKVQQNIMRAIELSLEVWKLGAAAVCPHANTMFFTGAAPDSVWLKGDIAIMLRCHAVLMTPDWERSSGARHERDVALERGLPVFDSLQELAAWLNEEPASA